MGGPMHSLLPNDFSIPYPKMCALLCKNTVWDSGSSHVKNFMMQSASIGLPISHRLKPTSNSSSSNTVSYFSSSSSISYSWFTSLGFNYLIFATIQLSLNFLSKARLTSNGVSFIDWPFTTVPCLLAWSPPEIEIVTSISFVFLFLSSSV